MNIAICIIAYNRTESLKRVLLSLEQAYYYENVTLIISVDKSNTNTVENFAKQYKWKYGNKIVITHAVNLGLRKHVLQCGDLLYDYDALIVLEDDISVAPSFYYYAKQCIEKYSEYDDIAGISLYNFPLNYQNQLPFMPLHSDSDVYMMQCAQSWGQVWMKKQWFAFRKWYNNNSEEFGELPHLPKAICNWPKSSWLKYHTRYCIENKKYFIYPYVSLSTNNSDAGTHVGKTNTLFQAQMLYGLKKNYNLNPTIKYDGFFENENIYKEFDLEECDVCVDFYGEKRNSLKHRYWLTRNPQNNTILKSYSLSYKPYELNVIYNLNGDDLFLCDTNSKKVKATRINNSSFLKYLFLIPNWRTMIKRFILNIY